MITHSCSTNGLGWEVQAFCLLAGWAGVSQIFTTHLEAQEAMLAMTSNEELRVYEALAWRSI